MNIVVDIRCMLEPDYSGVPAYAYNLLKNLFKIDSKNHYFLFYNKYQKHFEVVKKIEQIYNLLNYPNVKAVDFHFPNKFFNFSLRFFKYPKLDKLVEKKIESKIDVWFSPNLGFLNFSKSRSFKFFLTIHDLSFERYPEFFASRKNFGINYIRGRFWHRYVGARRICRLANKIIAVSGSTKNDLMDIYKIPEKNIEVIYEGTLDCKDANCKDAKFCVPDVKHKYNLPERFILFLGTLEPRKNISGIIQAFKILMSDKNFESSDYHLVIAGKKGWLYEDLFKVAERSKIKDRIKFIGYVDEKDKPALYNLSSLFVFPSFYEGFGLPPLEAMAFGAPVIASTVFSLSEVVGDAGILVDPYNVNEISEAMKLVLSDEKLEERLIEKGLKRSKMFSWEKAARESLGVFEGESLG